MNQLDYGSSWQIEERRNSFHCQVFWPPSQLWAASWKFFAILWCSLMFVENNKFMLGKYAFLDVSFPLFYVHLSVCQYTHGDGRLSYARHSPRNDLMEKISCSSRKLWADTEGGKEWCRQDISNNRTCLYSPGRELFVVVAMGDCVEQSWFRIRFMSLKYLLRIRETLWYNSYIIFTRTSPHVGNSAPFSLPAFLGKTKSNFILCTLEIREGERREYIMNVRAHMSCRRWFQYHATVLGFWCMRLCQFPPFLSLFSSNGKNYLWLQFSCRGSIALLGVLLLFLPLMKTGEEEKLQKARRIFVESFLSGLWFSLDSFPLPRRHGVVSGRP